MCASLLEKPYLSFKMNRTYALISMFALSMCCRSACAQLGMAFSKSHNNSITAIKVFCRNSNSLQSYRTYGTIGPILFNYLSIKDSFFRKSLCEFNLPDSLKNDLFLYPTEQNSILKFSDFSRDNEIDLRVFDTFALIVVQNRSLSAPYLINISTKGQLRINGNKALPVPLLFSYLKQNCSCDSNDD